MASWQQTLAELARDQAGSLKRQAFLLCGDAGQAEDLVQDALVRAFARPLRAPRPGAAEAYVRVIMVNLFIDIDSWNSADFGRPRLLCSSHGTQRQPGPAGCDRHVARRAGWIFVKDR